MRIEIARPLGIPLRMHGWGFLLLCATLFVGTVFCFRSLFPAWGLSERSLAALAVVTLFVLSVLLHEAAHAFVATRNGMRVAEVELLAFGAKVSLQKPIPDVPLRVAVAFAAAGPLSDLLLAGLLTVGAALSFGRDVYLFGVCFVALAINLSLAAGNLVPIPPLDGGQIMRCGVSAWKGRRG